MAAGFLFENAMGEVAAKYPQQKFLIIDSVVKDKAGKTLPNVANAVFAEHEGSFLVGVAAGLKAKADKKDAVGFVGGMKFPLIEKFEAGFEQGVKAVFPTCKVLVDYAGDFGEPWQGPGPGRQAVRRRRLRRVPRRRRHRQRRHQGSQGAHPEG